MIKHILLVFVACMLTNLSLGQDDVSETTMSVSGKFQGKNLFVKNPRSEDSYTFCVKEVTVNDLPITDGLNSNAFEIDFEQYGVSIGEDVVVTIEHEFGCKPRIINPEVLLAQSTFEIVSSSASSNGDFTWTTTNENGALTFKVEQFRWEKWIEIGEVDGEGNAGEHDYSFKVTPHSGLNKVRVVQIDHTGRKRKSAETSFTNNEVKEVSFKPTKVSKIITFSCEGLAAVKTRYEIYDPYGSLVKRGYSESIELENLEKGVYYLNFDNQTDSFIKK
jgi:hypothetical protein